MTWRSSAWCLLAFATACGGQQIRDTGDAGDAAYRDGEGGGRAGSGGDAGGRPSGGGAGDDAGTPTATDAAPVGPVLRALRAGAVSKIDLLFMIDNSSTMSDKQSLLAQAVPDMMARLVTPNCVDAGGHVVGRAATDGTCSAGSAEFPPVQDLHVGIVTSSLGGRGGNECPASDVNPANTSLNAHEDDQAHLINRGGDDEHNVAAANPNNFLAWFPSTAANAGKPAPAHPETQLGAPGQPGTLVGDFTDMISGVHEHGCGYEAQNEAWYRFLVQPDPFASIGRAASNPAKATLDGYDDVILQQRAAFLRPDSLLAVIVLTDENEEVANPLSIEGQGWLFENFPWPNSPSGGGAPEGTIECAASGPNDPSCTSCAFTSVQGAANFATRCPNDPPQGVQGYLDPSDDQVNVRFFNQKQRFGVFSGYPISRYVRGLQSPTVPDRAHEVDGNGNYVGDQDLYANCVNPIYAANLPTSSADPSALCQLQRGPRTPGLVLYAAIAGVPHQLLQAAPGDPECPAGTASADCPQKAAFSDADWTLMTGADPANEDFTGADFHMIESIVPRTSVQTSAGEGTAANASSCPPTANDSCDPVNGREWNTNKNDLQFACIFHFENPATGAETPKDCTSAAFTQACDCATGSDRQQTSLCAKNAQSQYTTNQIYGKAYPSVRELAIAHAMAKSPAGVRGVVSSLCPIHTHYANGDATDPLYGYRPAVASIVDRLKDGLGAPCLPQALSVDPSTGQANCMIIAEFPARTDAESYCDDPSLGLAVPPPGVLVRLQQALGVTGVEPICQMHQIAGPNAAGVAQDPDYAACSTGASTASQPGWCYVAGAAARGCSQQILFTPGEPPPGAIVTLACNGP